MLRQVGPLLCSVLFCHRVRQISLRIILPLGLFMFSRTILQLAHKRQVVGVITYVYSRLQSQGLGQYQALPLNKHLLNAQTQQKGARRIRSTAASSAVLHLTAQCHLSINNYVLLYRSFMLTYER